MLIIKGMYSVFVKKISGKTDATPYFALAPILTLPVGMGFPLVFGRMLDSLSFLQEDAYRLLFGVSAVFILVTLYFTFQVNYEGYVEDEERKMPGYNISRKRVAGGRENKDMGRRGRMSGGGQGNSI